MFLSGQAGISPSTGDEAVTAPNMTDATLHCPHQFKAQEVQACGPDVGTQGTAPRWKAITPGTPPHLTAGFLNSDSWTPYLAPPVSCPFLVRCVMDSLGQAR